MTNEEKPKCNHENEDGTSAAEAGYLIDFCKLCNAPMSDWESDEDLGIYA